MNLNLIATNLNTIHKLEYSQSITCLHKWGRQLLIQTPSSRKTLRQFPKP